jgi:hypothetical protein
VEKSAFQLCVCVIAFAELFSVRMYAVRFVRHSVRALVVLLLLCCCLLFVTHLSSEQHAVSQGLTERNFLVGAKRRLRNDENPEGAEGGIEVAHSCSCNVACISVNVIRHRCVQLLFTMQ